MKLYWPLLILFQIWLATEMTIKPINAASGFYRHEEREAAIKAQAEHSSPETKAAVQKEMHLSAEHKLHQQLVQCGIFMGAFFGLDVVGYFAWRNFRRNLAYKPPSA
jgi:hypothetical protein